MSSAPSWLDTIRHHCWLMVYRKVAKGTSGRVEEVAAMGLSWSVRALRESDAISETYVWVGVS